VDDDRAGGVVIGGTVLELEALRELEVELDSGTLEGTFECVADGDVDLGAIESTISGVDFPLPGVLLVKCLFELLEGTGEG
jgi:hypothetical protein